MAKYIHKFDTVEQADNYIDNQYEEPFVSCVNNVNGVEYNLYGLNGHGYVDLGLPSGTIWATCNVGASSPEEYGDYFAWGEVEPKSSYNWNNYIYGSGTPLQKYNEDDWKAGLDIQDDAAHINMGGHWVMPSKAYVDELVNGTTSSWETLNGVNGRRFTGSNGNSIFIPASGYKMNSSSSYAGSSGFLWERSIDLSQSANGMYYSFGSSGSISTSSMSRMTGLCVRGIIIVNPIRL